MNWIVSKKNLWNNVVMMEVKVPEVAVNWKPGQYVNIKLQNESENIPVIISSCDQNKGTIKLYIQKTNTQLGNLVNLNMGDEVYSVDGPYGNAIEAGYRGTVLCAAGAVGISHLYPIVRAMHAEGNRVIVVIAAKNCDYIILEKELRNVCDELIIMTDDGSSGNKGLLVHGMYDVLKREKVDKVITIGATYMVKYSSLLAQKFNVENTAILYSQKIIRKGVMPVYRVNIVGGAKAICVEGPEFNAYYTNFDEMIERLGCKEDFAGNQNYAADLNVSKYGRVFV
jgi:NAD(P)H-flavin reductase